MTRETVNRILCVAAFVLLAFSLGCSADKKVSPVARQGVLDLRGWDFKKEGPVRLDGEWEFYWGRFLTAEDFHGPRPHSTRAAETR